MKNIIYTVIVSFLIIGCNAYKSASKKIVQGNYSEAFEKSIKLFKRNASEKKKDKQVLILQESFIKANEKEEQSLKSLKNAQHPNYKNIYYTLASLYNRTNSLKPALPLYYNGNLLDFNVKDYSSELIVAKENYLGNLYSSAESLLKLNDKAKAREAHSYLSEIQNVDKNYRNVTSLLKKAYNIGADIILVKLINKSQRSLPNDFEYSLINSLNTKNYWVQIITNGNLDHDYDVNVFVYQVSIGGNIIRNSTHNFEKDIIDGWEYEKDSNGNIVLDSSGNPIKKDKYVRAYAQVTEFIHFKEAVINGEITVQTYNGKKINNYPYATNFIFEDTFAQLTRGDIKAVSDWAYYDLLNHRPEPFPDDYTMISACRLQLRDKLSSILNSF